MLNFFIFLYLRAFKISCSAELSMEKSFITLAPDFVSEPMTYDHETPF